MWRYNPMTRVPERVVDESSAAKEAAAKEPTHFDTTDFSKFLQVSKDKLSLKYTGPGDHETDVGCIQGNHAVPRHKRIYYYEVEIVDAGTKGLISIGFAEKGFNLGKHPGSEQGSYGYCSETGHKMNASPGQQRGVEYGQPYTTGDIVGAGIVLDRQEMFFTRNGNSFGKAFGDVLKAPLLPTVGLHSRDEHVEANFSGPFIFDLEGMEWEERRKQTDASQSVEISQSLSHEVVLDYLLHQGYAKTLRSFVQSTGLTQPFTSKVESNQSRVEAEFDTLEARHHIRETILGGHAHKALDGLRCKNHSATQNSHHDGMPGSLAIQNRGDPDVDFFLRCLSFVELIREQKLEEAVAMARESLSFMRGAFLSRSDNFDAMLRDVVALLAYVQPESSPMAPLLRVEQREYVADMVNEAIIKAEMEYRDSSSSETPLTLLERLLTQLVATQAELHMASGGLGQRFQLSEHLRYLKEEGVGRRVVLRTARSPHSQISRQEHEAGTNGVAHMDDDH